MLKTTILSLLGLIIIGGGAWTYSNYTKYAPTTYIKEGETAPETTNTPTGNTSNSGETTKPTVTTVNTVTGETTPGAPTYTMAQVSTHTDASSCYTVISSVVYDLTMWVNMHPGGKSPILLLCGHDGTTAFMNKHMGAAKQMGILARYKIGLLAQ